MADFNLFETLIFIGETLTEFMNNIWQWFTNPITIGDLTFTPIESLPIVGVALLIMWIIKTFVPVA